MLNKKTEINFYHFRKIWEKRIQIPVIHCGAHTGEESPTYFDLNMFPVYWIEAQPKVIDDLKENVYRYPLNEVVEAALWNESGELLEIFVSQDSFSSSLLKPTNILDISKNSAMYQKIKVRTKTLDELNLQFYEEGLLVLDVQGAELNVLQGSAQVLANSKWVYCEVSKVEMYQDGANWSDIQNHLKNKGFRLIDWQYDQDQGWGNALYRKGRCKVLDPIRRKMRMRLHMRSWDLINEIQQKW
jgi:FkbM family methyltransferase